MNAFSPIETEHRLAGILRQGAHVARSSSHLVRLRRHLARSPFLFFIAGVAAAASFYYFILAAPLYTSETRFAIRGRQAQASSPLMAALSGSSSGATDTPLLQPYLSSADMLKTLDAQIHLRQEYSAFRLDFFNHLSAGASDRRFLAFYNDMVTLDYDSQSNVLTLHVDGFSRQSAKATADAVLKLSEAFINTLSRQSLDEGTRSARHDLALAQQADLQAHAAVSSFQGRSGSLDPAAYGTSASGAIFGVEANIGQARAQLASMMTYSTANAPQVRQLQAQIAALQQQEAQLKQKLVGQSNGAAIVNQLGTFQTLVQKQTYADQRVAVIQAILDQAMSTAAQKQEFVVLISGPDTPDTPTPRAWWGLATVIVVASFIYAGGRLAIASIRDHQM